MKVLLQEQPAQAPQGQPAQALQGQQTQQPGHKPEPEAPVQAAVEVPPQQDHPAQQ